MVLKLVLLLTGCGWARAQPSIYVIGDSTAQNTGGRGWADPFAAYFDASKVNAVNRARAGRSSRTFITEGLWDKVRDALRPGDFVLIQFGHNDGGPLETKPARGSLPGLGEESRAVTLPDGKQETVYSFGHYTRQFIAEARARGATPILLSTTVRNIWKDGKVERGPGRYREWTSALSKAEGVTYADVTAAIAAAYERLGEERVKAFFPEDKTHTSPAGADFNASIVTAALKGLPGSPFVELLSNKGRALEPYPPVVSGNGMSLNLPTPANPDLPTLFLIGDSTVRNGRGDGANGQWGWGEPLVAHFDTAKINVVNRAVGGLSSRTYFTMGHWTRVLAMIKRGDYVVMQFGHNDGGAFDDPARARGTIRGAGEETKEIENPITKSHEVVHSYGWYLRQFIAQTRAAGATPVVCTLVPRKTWKDGRIERSAGYAVWAAAVAKSEGAPLVDLNEKIASRYDELGQAKVEPLFADEHTHTSRAGAELNADIVADALPYPISAFVKRGP